MAEAVSALKLTAAFLVVYVVWGSTFLGIRLAVHDLPPALLAGTRFIVAGLALGLIARLRGQALPPRRREWGDAALMGLLMIVAGNGLVTWGEQWVPSNLSALIVTTSALWIAWFGTFGPRGHALSARVKMGLVIGFAGAVLMLVPGPGHRFAPGNLAAELAILGSTVCWAAGAMYGRSLNLETPPLMFTAIQMFVGGIVLFALGLATGEATRWHWTLQGIGALVYLTLFGSCLAYTTYVWLLRHATPDKLSTISYVNPMIALLLGWWVLDERLSGPRLAGMVVILAGVILVTARSRKPA